MCRATSKRAVGIQGIGRSKGGMTTKILVITDALGNLARLRPMSGQQSDSVEELPMIAGIASRARKTDRSFQADVYLATAIANSDECPEALALPMRKSVPSVPSPMRCLVATPTGKVGNAHFQLSQPSYATPHRRLNTRRSAPKSGAQKAQIGSIFCIAILRLILLNGSGSIHISRMDDHSTNMLTRKFCCRCNTITPVIIRASS